MAKCEYCQPQLDLTECQTREEVGDGASAARAHGIEVLLIDTSARNYEPQIVALIIADLIIAPAIGQLEARLSISAGK